jgi:hypothetical protein
MLENKVDVSRLPFACYLILIRPKLDKNRYPVSLLLKKRCFHFQFVLRTIPSSSSLDDTIPQRSGRLDFDSQDVKARSTP